nr:selenide, water dikinase SelD [Bacteroidia bacterium]
PIGTGILATALKRGLLLPEDLKNAISVMTELNTLGTSLSEHEEVHAMTDITGFGLLGHLIEMCEGSGVSAELDFKKIPLIDNLKHYTDQFILPDSVYRNWNAFEKKVSGISGPAFMPLCDPQTSGGLLVSVDPEFAMKIKEYSLLFLNPIGRVINQIEATVVVNEE